MAMEFSNRIQNVSIKIIQQDTLHKEYTEYNEKLPSTLIIYEQF